MFYSKIVCESEDGKLVEIDARTSDAIAIGIRANCPVYTYEHILSSAGIQLDDDMEQATGEEFSEEPSEKGLSGVSDEELAAMLEEAINLEDYEKASEIRDEMNKRN